MSSVANLLRAVTAAGNGAAVNLNELRRGQPTSTAAFQASGQTTSGAGSATIAVQVSNDGANWMTVGTIVLTLSTTTSTDGFAMSAPWEWVRGVIAGGNITGTGASVDLNVAVV